MADLTALRNLLRSTGGRIAATRAERATQINKLSEIDADQARAEADLARLLELVRDDSVKSVLSGAGPSADKPKRRTRIINLQEQIEAMKMARPALSERLKAADQAEAEARRERADALIPVLCDMRRAALEDCRKPMNEFFRHLVRMAAVDIVQDRLVGEKFTISSIVNVEGLFKAVLLAEKMHAAAAPRLRALLDADLQEIRAAISASASNTLQQVRLEQAVD